MSCLTVTSLSLCRFGFKPRTVHVGFMVDQVAVVHMFLQVLCCATSILCHNACSFMYHECYSNWQSSNTTTAVKLHYLHNQHNMIKQSLSKLLTLSIQCNLHSSAVNGLRTTEVTEQLSSSYKLANCW